MEHLRRAGLAARPPGRARARWPAGSARCGGDVVGIDILERGGGRAIDELVVELPDEPVWSTCSSHEIGRSTGVDVEDVRPVADALHDPRLDALETAAILVGAGDRDELLERACASHAARTVGAEWAAVVDLDDGDDRWPPTDPCRPRPGSRPSSRAAGRRPGSPPARPGPTTSCGRRLPAAGLALVLGATGPPFRARERRQAAALARIVDTRFRELTRLPA